MIANTVKPIVAWSYTLETCRDIHQIAVAVAGSEAAFRADQAHKVEDVR
jgi:hypothetical protein